MTKEFKRLSTNQLLLAVMITLFASINVLFVLQNDSCDGGGELVEYVEVRDNGFSLINGRETLLSGVYLPQGAICIHTDKRSIEAINKTIHHEYLHYLIDEDEWSREHFCDNVPSWNQNRSQI